MTDATSPRAVRPQPTAVDLSAVDPSHTEAESPEQLLSTAVAETAAGVTGVHHLGGLAARTLDRASRQIRGTSSAPGVTVSDEDGVTTVDLDLVVEYPHPVDRVVDAARDQVSRAATQLVAGTVVINITVTDIHGPYDKDPAVLDAIDSAGDKAAELKDRASAKADELRSQARDQVDDLKERAGDLAAQASDTAGDVRDQADVKVAEMKERAGVLKEQMSDTADDLRERAGDARAQADDKVAEFAAKADEKVDSLREKADAKVDEVSDATSNAAASAGVTLDELDAEANEKLDELDAKADEKLDELDDAIDATPKSTTRPSGEAL